MLIVPHALHCVDSCIFVFTSFDTVWHTVLVSVPPPPPLTRELNIKVVGFVLKKILTYFGMLIVPHALHCVDGCIFVFISFDTVCCFGFIQCPAPPSPSPPPPPPPQKKKKKKNFFFYYIRFSFFVKIQNSLTRELTVIRVVGLPSPPPPRFPQLFFYQI